MTAAGLYAELRGSVAKANRDLAQSGLVVLTFGNVSGADREAGVMAIKPSGVSYDNLTGESVPVVELATGRVVAGEGRPSSDTPTHLALYAAFPTVGGIVHTHSPYATSWAQAGRALPCYGTTHADHFDGPVPVTRPMLDVEIDGDYERLTGEVIVETFDRLDLDPLRVPAALVAYHGPFVWGADVSKALENATALEVAAGAAFRTELLHSAATPIQDVLRKRHFQRKHGPDAYYGQPT